MKIWATLRKGQYCTKIILKRTLKCSVYNSETRIPAVLGQQSTHNLILNNKAFGLPDNLAAILQMFCPCPWMRMCLQNCEASSLCFETTWVTTLYALCQLYLGIHAFIPPVTMLNVSGKFQKVIQNTEERACANNWK